LHFEIPFRSTEFSMRTLQLFVDGAWRPSASGEQREVLNPATEEVEARFSAADAEEGEREGERGCLERLA
jgi:hypothetical protein